MATFIYLCLELMMKLVAEQFSHHKSELSPFGKVNFHLFNINIDISIHLGWLFMILIYRNQFLTSPVRADFTL